MSNSSLADFNGPNSRVRQRLIRQPPASDPGGSPPDQHTPRRWGLLMATSGDFHMVTDNLQLAFRAHARLEVGGVIVNDVSAFRADQMPYGGVKASGEGLRYAIEAM